MTHDPAEAKQLFYGLDTDANGRLEIEDFKFLEKHPCSFIPLLQGSSRTAPSMNNEFEFMLSLVSVLRHGLPWFGDRTAGARAGI